MAIEKFNEMVSNASEALSGIGSAFEKISPLVGKVIGIEEQSEDALVNAKKEIITYKVDELANAGKLSALSLFSEDPESAKKELSDYLSGEDAFSLNMALYVKTSKEIEIFKNQLAMVKDEEDLNKLKESVMGSSLPSASESPSPSQQPSPTPEVAVATTATTVAAGSTIINTSPAPSSRETISVSSPLEIKKLFDELSGKEKPDIEPFTFAMQGYQKLQSDLKNSDYITVVDYSKSNTKNRFYVINLKEKKVEYAVPVGHGKKSGGEFASSFSDQLGSNKTSLGFYRTPDEITKAKSKSRSGLLLHGIEESNDQAKKRGIFIHPGGVNHSEGCFTLPKDASAIMNNLKGDSLVFAYYPDKNYLAQSNFIDNSTIKDSRMVA
ncbi:MAG: murein L,D-transpeptidase catalytic domain family protein [Candidatus Absconditabacteria bacterium]|nr:murein L,D-transpeptidase catalytic domain family protein [Candidatus Absconditabacteria bacterium]MDD3868020.1 murein L,D-transpeptidase catalytic domain family protein [Candidatus Absconditabacteria bacterium]MDD4714267.1 murein L,D-transpeptidase catalytic domain family protein [Candidatus Absconditabacteria bacterium]